VTREPSIFRYKIIETKALGVAVDNSSNITLLVGRRVDLMGILMYQIIQIDISF